MRRLLKLFLLLCAVLTLAGAGLGFYLWQLWSSNLPYIGQVREYRPPLISEILSADGKVIGRFWEEKRILVTLEEVPRHLIQAFVAAEDARYFSHEGLDLLSILRAMLKNLQAGRIEQGGSTITQQVTRSLLLKERERTYRRKVREAILSIQLEKNLTKKEILRIYLNEIYLGQGAYGVEAAARTYFNKPARELSVAESALLAGLPQAPSRYSPVSHFDRAKARQSYVLERMLQEEFISEAEFAEALDEEIKLDSPAENTFAKAPYFTEHVRRYLLTKYGRESLYRSGLTVHTTVNLGAQEAARRALLKGLAELDKREGYRGPRAHISAEKVPSFQATLSQEYAVNPPRTGSVVEGLVLGVDDGRKQVVVLVGEGKAVLPLEEMSWARKPNPEVPYFRVKLKKPSEALRTGDVILVRITGPGKPPYTWELALEQEPEIQGALIALDPETGEVRAMLGGRDFAISQFDRATQSRRQPGSAFKPIVYSAAIDGGMSPATLLMDAPYVSDPNDDDEVWKPKNYKDRFFGPTLLRTALADSRNVITVKILKEIGVTQAIRYARMLGIDSELSPDLSLALGSSGLSLLELARAYAVFANDGMLIEPIFVTKILDRNGQVIEENQPAHRQVLSRETAYVITDLLKAVIQEGTGWRIRALRRPAAGKTGTTNDLRDAWFIGYTPELLAGVWVGYDDLKPMGKGETGSRAASPIWLDFMSEILAGAPVRDFPVPEGVAFARIDAQTGLLAAPHSEETVFQAFKAGSEPREYSPPPQAAKTGQFMQFDMEQ